MRISELVKKEQEREIQRIQLAKLAAKFSTKPQSDQQTSPESNSANKQNSNDLAFSSGVSSSSSAANANENTATSQSINKSHSAYNLNQSTSNSTQSKAK